MYMLLKLSVSNCIVYAAIELIKRKKILQKFTYNKAYIELMTISP